MGNLGKIWGWLKYPLALAILTYLYWRYRAQLHTVAEAPKQWGYFLMAIVLIVGANLLTFYRWFLLVWAQDFPFRLRDAMRLGFIGLMFNYVGPGSVGGDLVKAGMLVHRQTTRRASALATIFLDRILGLLALFMVGAVASLMPIDLSGGANLKLATALLWVGSISGLVGLAALLIPATTRWGWVKSLTRLRWVGPLLAELIYGVQLYQSRPRVLLLALVVSLFGHAGLIGGFYCCALWMQQPWIPDLTTHFYFMPNAELFGVIIPVPGGVGALEAAIEWFYGQLRPESVPQDQAAAAGLAAALAFRVVTIGIAAVGGAYYFVARREVAEVLREVQTSPKV